MPAAGSAAPTGRARDAEATKARILAAATDEFAEFGLAGARVDRIAKRADANKRLLYVYFGDKDALFDAVIEHQVHLRAEAVTLTPGDLGAYAGESFDHMLATPQALRLATWRTFERGEPTASELAGYKRKLELIRQAQRDGLLDDQIPAVDLFAITIRMIASWLQAPPALMAVASADPMGTARLRKHRAALVEAVRRVTRPR